MLCYFDAFKNNVIGTVVYIGKYLSRIYLSMCLFFMKGGEK
jgi:hypothetical protein